MHTNMKYSLKYLNVDQCANTLHVDALNDKNDVLFYCKTISQYSSPVHVVKHKIKQKCK